MRSKIECCHSRSTSNVLNNGRGVRLKIAFSLAALFVSIGPAYAANHYVRAGAGGNGSGSDWTNACTDFTGSCAVSSLVRGDIYYVAGGSYAGRTFNRTESGTTIITILGATVANHGTSTGWSDAYSVATAQALWTGAVSFTTRYHVFDGVYSPATPLAAGADNPNSYGFSVRSTESCASAPRVVVDVIAGDNAVKHTSVRNTCANSSNCMHSFRLGFSSATRSNYVFSHTYAENNQTDFQGSNLGGLTSPLIEYHYSKGQYSHPSCHGEVTAFSGTNATIRYNYFDQCRGTGCIASNGGGMSGFKIYGNVFNNVTNGGTGCVSGGNGAIAGAGASGIFTNAEIYNNTIIQPGMCYGWFYANGGSGNIAYNNIIQGNCAWSSNGTHDYNYYLNCNAGQGAPAETNRQISTVSPFVNATARNFHLATNTNAGISLSSLYNLDMDGVTRTTSPSRGAFQFGTQTLSTAPPQSLQVSVQ